MPPDPEIDLSAINQVDGVFRPSPKTTNGDEYRKLYRDVGRDQGAVSIQTGYAGAVCTDEDRFHRERRVRDGVAIWGGILSVEG